MLLFFGEVDFFFDIVVCHLLISFGEDDGGDVAYKDPEVLKKFLNEQGKILPRRITGTSLKFQRKVAQAIKRARSLALLPYVTDLLK